MMHENEHETRKEVRKIKGMLCWTTLREDAPCAKTTTGKGKDSWDRKQP